MRPVSEVRVERVPRGDLFSILPALKGNKRMKVRVPYIIQDPLTSKFKGVKPTESIDVEEEDFFLDGPVARRVAVLDFDETTGELLPGTKFEAPAPDRKLGQFAADPNAIYSRDFNRVSVFGTVLKTMYLFEKGDTLGRPLRWAFEAPQLLVVPRAGEMANAYYERESHSLQFFFFPSVRNPGQTIYTSLSQDIVAHETGHAILDGIAPDLYNAISPQSLALHEGMADLTAVLVAIFTGNLREAVLEQTRGSISDSTAFSSVAEEFGAAQARVGRARPLRNLNNRKTLCPQDTSKDESGNPNRVSIPEPHLLSEVLSGALYSVLVKVHEAWKKKTARKEGKDEFSVSGKALAIAAQQFKRMIFRALDYLPPGEVSFADYGRAILAADEASHPDDAAPREWIVEEFVRRCMAPSDKALEVRTNYSHPALKDLDLDTLVESDWAAYSFVNANRKLLGVPEGTSFRVRPRLDVTKEYYVREGKKSVRECILKVSWNRHEPNHIGQSAPKKREITVGTTLAIDWDTRRVRARLTSEQNSSLQDERDALLARLAASRQMLFGEEAKGPDGRYRRTVVRAETLGELMRVRGTARMLHISLVEEDEEA